MTDLTPAPAARLPWLDLWRGGAVVAMVIYHFAWDLSHLGFIATDVSRHPLWALFARSIAFSFLTIAGIALVLSHRRGMRWRSFSRRIGILVAAALAITAVTMVAMPESFVVFGILHAIAAGSVLALPFLRLPWFAAAGGAIAVLAIRQAAFLPGFVAWQQEAIGGWPFRILQHLGLTAIPPEAVDFVPIMPWFAATLVGVALGKLLLARDGAAPSEPGQRLAALEWLGRRSLPIYLLHQPVLFGGLMLLAQLAPGLTSDATASFQRDCVATCARTSDLATCERACSCIAARAARDPELNAALNRPQTDAVAQAIVAPHVQACLRP